MTTHGADEALAAFEGTYRAHVEAVERGDLEAVLADMAPGVVPGVFEGVRTPRGAVAAEVRRIGLAERTGAVHGVGEAVYTPVDGSAPIALRSWWTRGIDGVWRADGLENFEPEAEVETGATE
ncbi:hypothetical protein [Nocardioides zeae]|uniref:Nuclear transport factor 2 family protein n=1 Tax=Nocardioides zeae TaxID=1457234 RepID=A0A6P0HGT9_9ACTN|nr:hypothetical protein [Nocardioides zeae]NEN77863.1 hypothetical protein [Nocardioides zeae]